VWTLERIQAATLALSSKPKRRQPGPSSCIASCSRTVGLRSTCPSTPPAANMKRWLATGCNSCELPFSSIGRPWSGQRATCQEYRARLDRLAVRVNLICPAELVLVVHKGEWNLGRTDVSDLGHDEWLAWMLAAWSFPGEHAERVGYPAAFPEELPRRLIKLLSFPGDVVLDPFVGSGTTAVVARALGRRFWGCDRNAIAVARAQSRLDPDNARTS